MFRIMSTQDLKFNSIDCKMYFTTDMDNMCALDDAIRRINNAPDDVSTTDEDIGTIDAVDADVADEADDADVADEADDADAADADDAVDADVADEADDADAADEADNVDADEADNVDADEVDNTNADEADNIDAADEVDNTNADEADDADAADEAVAAFVNEIADDMDVCLPFVSLDYFTNDAITIHGDQLSKYAMIDDIINTYQYPTYCMTENVSNYHVAHSVQFSKLSYRVFVDRIAQLKIHETNCDLAHNLNILSEIFHSCASAEDIILFNSKLDLLTEYERKIFDAPHIEHKSQLLDEILNEIISMKYETFRTTIRNAVASKLTFFQQRVVKFLDVDPHSVLVIDYACGKSMQKTIASHLKQLTRCTCIFTHVNSCTKTHMFTDIGAVKRVMRHHPFGMVNHIAHKISYMNNNFSYIIMNDINITGVQDILEDSKMDITESKGRKIEPCVSDFETYMERVSKQFEIDVDSASSASSASQTTINNTYVYCVIV
jgi:hypothetical protein